MKSMNVFSFPNHSNWPQNETMSGTIHETQISSILPPPSISSHYISGSKDKASCYYGSFVCSDTLIIGSNFWTLSSFTHIPFIFTDYYILENNSLLKMALKFKRVQLTDFRTVQMEHFGENNVLVSICYCESQMNWWYNVCFFHRFTFEDLLSTRLLWVPSLWTTVGDVRIICNDTLYRRI